MDAYDRIRADMVHLEREMEIDRAAGDLNDTDLELDHIAFVAARYAAPEPLYLLEVCGPSDHGHRAGEFCFRAVGHDVPTGHCMEITSEAKRAMRLAQLVRAAACIVFEIGRIDALELYPVDDNGFDETDDCDGETVWPPQLLARAVDAGPDNLTESSS